jgi:hypothetical protein
MTITAHQFPSADRIERVYQSQRNRVRESVAALDSPTVNRSFVYYSLFEANRWSGTYALVLHRDDAEVVRHFQDAVTAARHLLEGTEPPLRTTAIDVTVSPGGKHTIVERDTTPRPVGVSLPTFHEALAVAISFGDTSACRAFATYPEERYRSSTQGVILSPTYYPHMRAYKACLLGNEAQGRREAEAVRAAAPNAGLKAEMQALIAVIDGDARTFQTSLDAQLAVHKQRYDTSEWRHDPDGYVSWVALMLCRLAKVHGFAVADDSYLPARLVPSTPVVSAPM